jgi:hypothetical protein
VQIEGASFWPSWLLFLRLSLQLNQIASFYLSNPGQQQQQAGGSGSTTSTTSPSGASVQNGSHSQHQGRHSNGHGSGSSSGMPGESPHLHAQPYGFQHGRTGKHDVRGLNGLNIGPLPTPGADRLR